MKNTKLFFLPLSAALALGACGSDEVEEEIKEDDEEVVGVVVTDDAFPVAGPLDADRQARMDTLDIEATTAEYDRNYAAIMAEAHSGVDMDSSSGSDSDTSGDMSDTAKATTASFTMPSRSEMSFGWLDRNDDGKLSVAEYAVWALPTNPMQPEPNDARPPFLTSEQINEAGRTFFYFDDDGSTYLSEDEFMDAQNSSRV